MTRSAITTRRYRPDDAAVTLDVFRRAIRITAAHDYTSEQRRAWAPDDLSLDDWAAEREAARTWVALTDDRVLGFTDLSPHGHVGMLYVHPDAARRGIASRLLAVILATAEAEALSELTVHASRTAQPFFCHHGFVAETEQQVARRGVVLTNHRMRRVLRPRPADPLADPEP